MKIYVRCANDIKKGKFYFDSIETEPMSRRDKKQGLFDKDKVKIDYIFDTNAAIKYAADVDEADWEDEDISTYLENSIDIFSMYNQWRDDLYSRVVEFDDKDIQVFQVTSYVHIYGTNDKEIRLRYTLGMPKGESALESNWSSINKDAILSKNSSISMFFEGKNIGVIKPNKNQVKKVIEAITKYLI